MTRSACCWLTLLISLVATPTIADDLERSLVVTATAYTSRPGHTDDDPFVAAWGDVLTPGIKAIAVSRDLIPEGLDRHAPVKIEGLPGVYLVLDKMHERWKKRIDIYMGHDLAAARAWGKRQVEINW